MWSFVFFLPLLREASKEEKHDGFLLVQQIDVRGEKEKLKYNLCKLFHALSCLQYS